MIQMTKQDITQNESPTVKQIRIAFEQTPSKLRAAEQGWRERRKEITKRIHPVQTSRVPAKGKAGVEVGHQAVYPAVNLASQEVVVSAEPTIGPPTPPQTPSASQENLQPRKSDKGDTPQPILAYPLAPTLTEIPLGRGGSLSIPHPSSPHEVKVRIGKQHISVLRGGNVLELGIESGKRTIHRKDHRGWSSTERKQWEMLRDLVEQVKRKTPRIKIYHPSALITITCSSPPDVIIAFTISQEPPNSKRATSKSKPVTMVKLVYSPLRGKITIDTDDKQGIKGETTFRTRRCIPLPPSHLDKLVARKGISSAQAALGLSIGQSWLAAEVEAINRFWALREEWLW